LAADEAFNPDVTPLTALAIPNPRPIVNASASLRDADGNPVYETAALLTQDSGARRRGDRVTLKLNSFAAAGATGKEFTVWLGAPVGTLPAN
jgi:hypothetical protein